MDILLQLLVHLPPQLHIMVEIMVVLDQGLQVVLSMLVEVLVLVVMEMLDRLQIREVKVVLA